jgi:hypothetical protein
LRLLDLIDAGDRIDEVVSRYPATRLVFEASQLRDGCWVQPIRAAAWRGGIELSGLLEELNQAVHNTHDSHA